MTNSPSAGTIDTSANDNLDRQLVPLLIGLSKATNALLALRLAALGLRIGQDDALLALDRPEPTSTAALAQKLGIRQATAAALVDRLVEKGLVRRRYGPPTEGAWVIPTQAGTALQQKVRLLHQQLEAELLQSRDGALMSELSTLQERLARMVSPVG
jgi:DNA-binding MarR family transcriptional regulator